jgi:hypothetical protein
MDCNLDFLLGSSVSQLLAVLKGRIYEAEVYPGYNEKYRC